jgi:hypothetical protein
MPDDDLQKRVLELVSLFQNDDERKKEAASKLPEDANTAKALINNRLDYIRLCIKYTLLDLDSTRRENMYLRKMLEQDGRQS